MLSQQSKYALRAMVYLSNQSADSYVKVEHIADKENLPSAYLSKIFKMLANSDVIVSRRGKNGGVQLNRKRKSVTFYDICTAVEDPVVKSECVLFKKVCSKDSPCDFHGKWSTTKGKLIEFLQATSLK